MQDKSKMYSSKCSTSMKISIIEGNEKNTLLELSYKAVN